LEQKSKKLSALTAAALVLPGMNAQVANAQYLPEKTTASYRFTHYQEADQPASFEGDDDIERYNISVHQFSLAGALGSSADFKFAALTETLSGASPRYVVEGDNGEPIQVMSGASIEEARDEVKANVGYYAGSNRTGLGFAFSTENDYQAIGGNIGHTTWLNDNNTTIDVGFGFSIDEITPTQQTGANRILSADKQSQTASLGFSQVINKSLLVGASASYTAFSGFLSDPYKLASVAGGLVADSRPNERNQAALDIQARQYIRSFDTALHYDYRYYADSWQLSSHTLSFGAYKNINTFQISGKVRYYNQNAASFYRDFYRVERQDGFYSSDYRLSQYDAFSYKLAASKSFDMGLLTLSFEDYKSAGRGSNPGLVDFRFITLGFDVKF